MKLDKSFEGAALSKGRDHRVTEALLLTGSDKVHRHRFDQLYRQIFDSFWQDATVDVFEVGVYQGASHNAWKSLVGRDGHVAGFDCDSRPETLYSDVAHYQGDQGSRTDLQKTANIYGVRTFDLVIDDGSHAMLHQKQTFEVFWSCVRVGGWYVCEDLHTSGLITRSPELAARYNPTDEPETALDYFLRLARESACRRGEVDEESGIKTLLPSMQFTFFSDAVAIRKMHDGRRWLWR